MKDGHYEAFGLTVDYNKKKNGLTEECREGDFGIAYTGEKLFDFALADDMYVLM